MDGIINSISIKNYRGFSEEQVLKISDIKNFTILIGQNNSGKSLISRLFTLIYSLKKNNSEISNISDKDFFDFNIMKEIEFTLSMNKDFFNSHLEVIHLKAIKLYEELNIIVKIKKVKQEGKSSYVNYIYLNNGKFNTHNWDNRTLSMEQIHASMSTQKFGLNNSEINLLISKLISILQSNILVFESIRSFEIGSFENHFVRGKELIEWIEKGESYETRLAKEKVAKYIKEYFNMDEPVDVNGKNNNEIIFTFKNQLKLSSKEIGTGYTMLYIILLEIFRNNKKIIVIDEIESHLQPGLIRILLNILRVDSNSQIILATHSTTVLESTKAGDYLYRFQKIKEQCIFEQFFRDNTSSKMLRTITNDLGIIPGDALLSNIVIWVEGPSELKWLRSYLKVYLDIYKNKNAIKFNIIEGLHYSILFTGGSLISNYKFEENNYDIDEIDIKNTIEVLRINPNPFVIIDSDNVIANSGKYKRIVDIAECLRQQNLTNTNILNNIKSEINKIEDCENLPNMWLLSAKELENYYHPQILKDFFLKRSKSKNSNITGVEKISDWDVYCKKGVGLLLEQRGLEEVKSSSGEALKKHLKQDLAEYLNDNLSEIHFEKNPESIEKPNEDLIVEITRKLDSLLDYILLINKLK